MIKREPVDKESPGYKWILEQCKKARQADIEDRFDHYSLYLIKKERAERAAGRK